MRVGRGKWEETREGNGRLYDQNILQTYMKLLKNTFEKHLDQEMEHLSHF